MKKLSLLMFGVLFLGLILAIPIYDEFESGSIDITKWTQFNKTISGGGAAFSLDAENGNLSMGYFSGGVAGEGVIGINTTETFSGDFEINWTVVNLNLGGGPPNWGACWVELGNVFIVGSNRTGVGNPVGNMSVGNWSLKSTGLGSNIYEVRNETTLQRTIDLALDGNLKFSCKGLSTGAIGANMTIDNVLAGIQSRLVQLNSPPDSLVTNANNLTFNATLTPSITPENNLTNATVFIWFSNSTIFNQTTDFTPFANISQNVSINIGNIMSGNFIWNVFGCQENFSGFGNCSFATLNRTFERRAFEVTGETFNFNVFETDKQDFKLNITTITGILAATSILNYNGTSHIATTSCSGGSCFINSTIDIPIVNAASGENKTFFWSVTVFDGASSFTFNTTERDSQQNVSNIFLEECGGSFTTQALNFTAFQEKNLTRVDPFNFDATFDFWLGDGNVKRNQTVSDVGSEVLMCLSPTDKAMFLDGTIEYDDKTQNTTLVQRNYYFQNDSINSVSQDIHLFLLDAIDSTTFILKVQNDFLLPLRDHLIFIQKFYPGENLFRTVQIAKTDGSGQTVGFFEVETIDYLFIIKNGGRVKLITEPQKMVGEAAPFTITFTIGEDLGAPWQDLEELDDLDFSLLFNKSSNIVTFTYSDTSSLFSSARLFVEQRNVTSSTNPIICNTTSTFSSATITCDVGILTSNNTGSYTAVAFITRVGSSEVIVDVINFVIETLSGVFGLLGVLLAWFIILVAAFAFKFNEIAGIFMINASIIFVNLIGLVSFGPLAISSIIAVSILIVAVLEK